jgi:rRNA-processing protein FCF1
LAELRAETGLKLPDCCVSRAAQQSGAAILTFDHRLGADARERGIELAQIAR